MRPIGIHAVKRLLLLPLLLMAAMHSRCDVLAHDFVQSLARRVEGIGRRDDADVSGGARLHVSTVRDRPAAILAMHLCGRLHCWPELRASIMPSRGREEGDEGGGGGPCPKTEKA